MKICQEKMDHNQKILKRYLKDGHKPILAFGSGLHYISKDFLKMAEIPEPEEDKQ